ncbi:hypothetical protein EV360DRAFT_71506 [Lentinula raphanica]|nr:hypothetical protein EV360DRAFT_71506 [Lentinula raphanica]
MRVQISTKFTSTLMHSGKPLATQPSSTHKRPFSDSILDDSKSSYPPRASSIQASKKIRSIYETGVHDSQITSQAWVERLYDAVGQSTYLDSDEHEAEAEALNATPTLANVMSRGNINEYREIVAATEGEYQEIKVEDYMQHEYIPIQCGPSLEMLDTVSVSVQTDSCLISTPKPKTVSIAVQTDITIDDLNRIESDHKNNVLMLNVLKDDQQSLQAAVHVKQREVDDTSAIAKMEIRQLKRERDRANKENEKSQSELEHMRRERNTAVTDARFWRAKFEDVAEKIHQNLVQQSQSNLAQTPINPITTAGSGNSTSADSVSQTTGINDFMESEETDQDHHDDFIEQLHSNSITDMGSSTSNMLNSDPDSSAHLEHEENLQQNSSAIVRNMDSPPPDEHPDTGTPNFVPQIEDIAIATKFIDYMKNATLNSSIEPLPSGFIEQLQHPHEHLLEIDDPDHRLSLDIFLALTNASQESYNQVRDGILRRYPDSGILTYHQVKKMVEQLSGLQALRSTEEGSAAFRYRVNYTKKVLDELEANDGKKISPYTDFFDGTDYLDAVKEGKINDEDIGGISIWDALSKVTSKSNLFLGLVSADTPAMACLTGFVARVPDLQVQVPGPAGHKTCRLKDKHYYPARLKPDNYNVVGSNHPDVDIDDILLHFTSENASKRYQENLNHLIASPNKTQYANRRLETGIVKPSIFSGLSQSHILGIPAIFSGDCMHLPALNMTDLYLSLWRGTIDCDKNDDKSTWDWAVFRNVSVWKAHGKEVAAVTPYIPGSFDRPPRNIAEKISSGYKAWEFLLYFFGLGPCLLYGLLPEKYWMQYCKLAEGILLLLQEEIPPHEIVESNRCISESSTEFEELYVQRKATRIHFVRPSVHGPSHMPHEVLRIGPGIIYSQWTMERTIGNLGEEINQHSNPYANLSNCGIRRAQINALKAMIPDIEPSTKPLPRGAQNIGDGFVMLRARDSIARKVTEIETEAFRVYLEEQGVELDDDFEPHVVRWARIRLPNGQIARSRWKEDLKDLKDVRMARNVKLEFEGETKLAEVHFYTALPVNNEIKYVAVGSFYGQPHEQLRQKSSNRYISVQHFRDIDLAYKPQVHGYGSSSGLQSEESVVPFHVQMMRLKEENQQLKLQNVTLATQVQTWKEAHMLLTQTIKEFRNAVPLKAGISLSTSVTPMPTLSRSKYPKVRFWERSEWISTEQAETKLKKEDMDCDPHIRGELNVGQRFVELESGEPISGSRAKSLRNEAYTCFQGYLDEGKAPATWGQASYEVKAHFISVLTTNFPELCLCEENWKVKHLATNLYPNWKSGKKFTKKTSKHEKLDYATKRPASHVDGPNITNADGTGYQCDDVQPPPSKKAKGAKVVNPIAAARYAQISPNSIEANAEKDIAVDNSNGDAEHQTEALNAQPSQPSSRDLGSRKSSLPPQADETNTQAVDLSSSSISERLIAQGVTPLTRKPITNSPDLNVEAHSTTIQQICEDSSGLEAVISKSPTPPIPIPDDTTSSAVAVPDTLVSVPEATILCTTIPDTNIPCSTASMSPAVDSVPSPMISSTITSSNASEAPISDAGILPTPATNADSVPSSKLKLKKAAIMKPSKSSTPRNLCAIQWCTKNPGGLSTEFAAYWISIQDTPDAEPFKHASREADAAKKNAARK